MRSPIGSVPPSAAAKRMPPAPTTALRHGVGFDHLVVAGGRLQLREIFSRRIDLIVGQHLRHGDHDAGAHIGALSGLEQPHLATDVIFGQSREPGGFRMAVARGQMTLRAGTPRRLRTAMRDDLGHRRMVAGEPVRRIERVVDLRLGVLLGAARHGLHDRAVGLLRRRRDRIGPFGIFGRERDTGQHGKQRQSNQSLHGFSPTVCNLQALFGGAV